MSASGGSAIANNGQCHELLSTTTTQMLAEIDLVLAADAPIA
jgi:hypothetical protein